MELHVLRLGVHNDNFPPKGEKAIERTIDPICSSIILLKGKNNILIDTGNHGFREELLSNLKKHKLTPEDIDYVINTHTHFDHCSNNHLFKNARIISKNLVWGQKSVINYKKTDDITIEGLELIETPGHKEEHISVLVKTENKNYIIAGDAIEEKNIVEKKYENRPAKEEIYNSIRKIIRVADIIIPGHGPIIEGTELEKLKKIIEEV